MAQVREIPPGSGINGRPILDDGQLTRHLAYYAEGTRGIWGWTWCGEPVPADHMCPDENDLERQRAHFQRPVGNCVDCDAFYRHDLKAPRKLPDWV